MKDANFFYHFERNDTFSRVKTFYQGLVQSGELRWITFQSQSIRAETILQGNKGQKERSCLFFFMTKERFKVLFKYKHYSSLNGKQRCHRLNRICIRYWERVKTSVRKFAHILLSMKHELCHTLKLSNRFEHAAPVISNKHSHKISGILWLTFYANYHT